MQDPVFATFAECILMQKDFISLRTAALHLHRKFQDPFTALMKMVIGEINSTLGSGKEEDWMTKKQEWSQTLLLLKRIKTLHAQAVALGDGYENSICFLLQQILVKAEKTQIFPMFASIEEEIVAMESNSIPVVVASPVVLPSASIINGAAISVVSKEPAPIREEPAPIQEEPAPIQEEPAPILRDEPAPSSATNSCSRKRNLQDSQVASLFSEEPRQKQEATQGRRVKAIAKVLKSTKEELNALKEKCKKSFQESKVLHGDATKCTIETFTGHKIEVYDNAHVIYVCWSSTDQLQCYYSCGFGRDTSLVCKHRSEYYIFCARVFDSHAASLVASSKTNRIHFADLARAEIKGEIPPQMHVGIRKHDDWIPVLRIVGMFPFDNKGVTGFHFK